MTKLYHTAVVIGRFEPLHNAHVQMIKKAQEAATQVVVIVGSADRPRTYKDPFTFAERKQMILDEFPDVFVEPNIDTIYNDAAWVSRVQGIVSKYHVIGTKVAIVGHKKDESSFYLDMFPQWELINFPLSIPLNATDVRDLYFRKEVMMDFLSNVVPAKTMMFLRLFKLSPAFQDIIEEREFHKKHKEQFSALKFPPIFVTVDACVIQSGHVLMIKRRAIPGRGLWAFPGGYVNANTDSSIVDAMIRELREETCIKVPEPALRGSIVDTRVFDAVKRSERGRIITHAFKIVLPDGPLSKVKGADDAEKAKWIPIAEVKSEECFEDHFEIKTWAVGV